MTPEEAGELFTNLRKAVAALKGVDAVEAQIKALEDENGMIDGAKVQALVDDPSNMRLYRELLNACYAIAAAHQKMEDDWASSRDSKWK